MFVLIVFFKIVLWIISYPRKQSKLNVSDTSISSEAFQTRNAQPKKCVIIKIVDFENRKQTKNAWSPFEPCRIEPKETRSAIITVLLLYVWFALVAAPAAALSGVLFEKSQIRTASVRVVCASPRPDRRRRRYRIVNAVSGWHRNIMTTTADGVDYALLRNDGTTWRRRRRYVFGEERPNRRTNRASSERVP